MARLAAIDIGSNALRLRIVDVDPPAIGPDGPRFTAFRDVFVDRAPVRLGHDVFTRGFIEPGVIGAACEALRRFRAAMDGAKVDRYRAVATSAAREAQNGDLFVERAEREAGVHVEVIEGTEEARLVQLAVAERIDVRGKTALLVDIGGGSTELTLMSGKGGDRTIASFTRSLPVGTVRLVEAFLEGRGPIDDEHRSLLDEYVGRSFGEAVPEILQLTGGDVDLVIGTGGNIETLADLCPVPGAFSEGRAIEVSGVERLLDELCARSVDERAARYALRPDRADTIVPAATILARVARAFGRDAVSAPGVGLKEGVLVDIARRHFVPEDFPAEAAALNDACLRLGRRYHFDEAHGTLVARLAVRLFDDLGARHRLGPRDRILLHAASLLHDIGDFIRYEGHHKHSYYLIANSDVMGVTPAERAIMANVARYHRKSAPQLDHDNFRALSREDRGKVKAMAAILRVADALDREHRGKVGDVAGRLEGDTLILEVSGAPGHDGASGLDGGHPPTQAGSPASPDPPGGPKPRAGKSGPGRELEEWTVRAKAGLLKEAFGLDVRIVDGAVARASRQGGAPPAGPVATSGPASRPAPTVRSME
jgi:exopolyphosphatase/guanosine-5'-triphosphate,3'-diphosphate pyrophosphatase